MFILKCPIFDVKGFDAVKFLNSICINDFSKLGPNGIRHAVICNKKGQIMTAGVVLKISDDTYRTYWLNPPIQYFLETSGMDVSGNLAYEVHEPMDEFEDIYEKIWKAGQSFGAKKLGINAYNLMNHTEAGFPNIHIHYPLPWYESDDDGLEAFCDSNPMFSMYNRNRRLWGSVGDDLQSRFVTSYDVGWGFLVNFNHDCRGKKALQKEIRVKVAKFPYLSKEFIRNENRDVSDIPRNYK